MAVTVAPEVPGEVVRLAARVARAALEELLETRLQEVLRVKVTVCCCA
jgi:hypothetical protein